MNERDLKRHALWLLKRKQGVIREPEEHEVKTAISSLNRPLPLKATGVCPTCGNRVIIETDVTTIKGISGVVLAQEEGKYYTRCAKCGQIVYFLHKSDQ